ncbi:MAG TPA: aldo/keto reductase family protein [candidate division Zixibacteria bacterium]|nr:aldo/keto reductase family protein [candidate division Zixibacteria bacterium]
MKYRRVGRSGLKVSEIALGAWLTYGGPVSASQTAPIVRRAIAHGVNFIDLADIYAWGAAEETLGRILKEFRRADLVLSSKLFWPMSDNPNDRGLSRKHIRESIEGTLRRLGTDYLDIYFCHRFDPETEVEETVRAMDDLVRQGKIIYWGTSVWEAAQIERAVGLARDYRAYAPIVEQPRYHLLDRHIEPEIMPVCAHNGMGLTVWSPLAQGLLTGKYNAGIPDGSRGATSMWLKPSLTEANIAAVRRLSELAASLDITVARLALAWVLRRPEISCAIIGATAPEQVDENVKAADTVLSAETLAAIEQILGNDPAARTQA